MITLSWPPSRNAALCLAGGVFTAAYALYLRPDANLYGFAGASVAISLMLAFLYSFFAPRTGLLCVFSVLATVGFILGVNGASDIGATMPKTLTLFSTLMLLLLLGLFDPVQDPDELPSSASVVPSLHGWFASIGALGSTLLPVMLLVAPLAFGVAWVKAEFNKTLTPNPASSTSALVVFKTTFDGASPKDPYWRDLRDLPFPADEINWLIAPESKVVLENHQSRAIVVPASAHALTYTYRFEEEDIQSGIAYRFNLDGTYFQPGAAGLYSPAGPLKAFDRSFRQHDQNAAPWFGYTSLDFSSRPTGMGDRLARARVLMPKTLALVQSWQDQGLKDQALVDKALAYFKKNLVYNFDHQSETYEKSRLDHFLFTEKKGVCRHFANTFAIMMRIGGIPSRLVVGYRGGVFDPQTNTWTVRMRDGHVWTEVWLPPNGWTRVDPTSVVPVEKGMPKEGFEAVSLLQSRAQVGMSDWFSVANVVGMGQGKAGPPQNRPPLGAFARKLLPVLIGMGLLFALFIRRKSKIHLTPNDKAWQKVCKTLSRRGHALSPSMGPASIGAQVAPTLPASHRAQWQSLVQSYERWKFGHYDTPKLAQKLLIIRRHIPKSPRKASAP